MERRTRTRTNKRRRRRMSRSSRLGGIITVVWTNTCPTMTGIGTTKLPEY